MKINPHSNSYAKSNVCFSAIPIREASLLSKAGEGKSVKALLVELEKSDSYDNKVMDSYADNIFSKKSVEPRDSIFLELYHNFKENRDWSKFYALVFPKKEGYKMLGCVRASDCYTILSLNDLYVVGNHAYKNKNRSLKGAGEILLGETIKFAKDCRVGDFLFASLADAFYNHSFSSAKIHADRIHINTNFDSGFLINNSQFDKFLKYCSEKYNIDYSKKSL